MEQRQNAPQSAAAKAEAVRVQRLREDAQRPMSVNLAEGIALSHKLMRFAGSAKQDDEAQRGPDPRPRRPRGLRSRG
jgi:hypothetical protein